jgi:hypothetical protein
MIDSIVFFNNFHNGDVFFSKPYVKHLSEILEYNDYSYAHNNDHKIVKDLNMNHFLIGHRFQQDRTISYENKLYINTWIGNYLSNDRNCNWISLHEMYEELYNYLQELLDKEIKILDREFYQTFIDFSVFDVPLDFECDYENTIMFSNGPVLSGQSSILNTSNIVKLLCDRFPDKKIILTHQSDIENNNIVYTKDIINTAGSDLNEISWLSTKCKYIIGRQSGPFSFMQINENLNDKNKVMISMSNSEAVDWLYNIKVPCKYINLLDQDEDILIENIYQELVGAC